MRIFDFSDLRIYLQKMDVAPAAHRKRWADAIIAEFRMLADEVVNH